MVPPASKRLRASSTVIVGALSATDKNERVYVTYDLCCAAVTSDGSGDVKRIESSEARSSDMS